MENKKMLPQLITIIGSIPFLYFVFTKKEPNWLYYASLAVIVAGTVYNMVVDWQMGNKKKVKGRLMLYGIFVIIAVLLGVFMKKGWG